MKQITIHKLQLLLIVVFFISQTTMIGFIISRSFQAQTRDLQTQKYIRCILLLRYDFPNLNEKSTKADAETALDTCASKV